MSKVTDKTENAEETKAEGIGGAIQKMAKEHTERESAIFIDLLYISIGILFSRCHLIFGAHPIGVALLSALPGSVWVTLIGAVIGALTLGEGGFIYAIISAAAVLLRVVISIGQASEGEGEKMFSENTLLRMSVSVIAGFISAIYEILLSGFTTESILFSLAMILCPPILVFVFTGIFSTGFSLEKLSSGHSEVFSLKEKTDHEKYNIIFFQCSALVTLFLVSLSLGKLKIFGINLSFIFVSFITLMIAKRFGGARAMASGFVASLGVGGIFSVSYALAGFLSGILFPFGLGYALIGGGGAMSLWSIYTSGLEGFLSTMPEYAIGAAIAIPFLKNITGEAADAKAVKNEEAAADMVGVFALSYRNKFSGSLDHLESSLSGISSVIKSYSGTLSPTEDDYTSMILDVISDTCSSCGEIELCKREDINPTKKNIARLTEKLLKRERILAEDINTATEFCASPVLIADEINMRAALLFENKYRSSFIDSGADQYDLFGKLISESRRCDRLERAQDTELSQRLTEALSELGFENAAAKVFGERQKHFIIAMEDEDGRSITSPEIKKKIEELSGVKTDMGEFYRKDKMALMECGVKRSYAVEYATAGASGKPDEVSGDTTAIFESEGDYFYALCSDGMGRGAEAKRTSDFVSKFLIKTLNTVSATETVMHLLNNNLRSRGRECSATVDLFCLDLLDGSATFIKSGAAPSFVKRDSSIFRIRSGTAPIGLMRTIDAEKIRVEVKGGDYIIMISDGVSQSAEETPWLLELLSKPPKESSRAYADYIMSVAKEKSKTQDDMSVIVLKILKLN